MKNNYIKLSTEDIVQLDDIIYISKLYHPNKDSIGFLIIYAGQEKIIIKYNYNPLVDISSAVAKLNDDRKNICKKIGIDIS